MCRFTIASSPRDWPHRGYDVCRVVLTEFSLSCLPDIRPGRLQRRGLPEKRVGDSSVAVCLHDDVVVVLVVVAVAVAVAVVVVVVVPPPLCPTAVHFNIADSDYLRTEIRHEYNKKTDVVFRYRTNAK